MNKEDVIVITRDDKKYNILDKEQFGDIIKITFSYEEETYFGLVLTISSSGNLSVKVKGRYGVDEEGLL